MRGISRRSAEEEEGEEQPVGLPRAVVVAVPRRVVEGVRRLKTTRAQKEEVAAAAVAVDRLRRCKASARASSTMGMGGRHSPLAGMRVSLAQEVCAEAGGAGGRVSLAGEEVVAVTCRRRRFLRQLPDAAAMVDPAITSCAAQA